MKNKTYHQLKRMSKQELWKYAIERNALSHHDIAMGCFYFDKSTVLEILSVTHREWFKKPFINGNKEIITI